MAGVGKVTPCRRAFNESADINFFKRKKMERVNDRNRKY